MKLIVGLGNPEPEYSWTRHNAGKDILNMYVENEVGVSKNDTWRNFSNKSSYIESTSSKYLKPSVFMNIIGEGIGDFVSYYKIEPQKVLVIYDELDLPVGSFKLNQGKGSRIHNGLISLEQYLDSTKFWHLRIGVREPEIEMSVQKAGRDPSRYVLQKLPLSHKKQIIKLYEDSLKKVLNEWLSNK